MAGKKRVKGKKIILLSDGTGNAAHSPHKTNVWRLYKALDLRASARQVAFYDDGVGTSGFMIWALLGKAFGIGLASNVRQIYKSLCQQYQPGDEIYAFGFSRGAFTIRVAVAMIAKEGIINAHEISEEELNQQVKVAYRKFRAETFRNSFLSFFGRKIFLNAWNAFGPGRSYQRTLNYGHVQDTTDQKLIKFVGVWDTVDAYGLPVDELTKAWDKIVWPLTTKDHNLSDKVEWAAQALALDERRQSFEPMLWNEKGDKESRIKQVWFAGVHANVGGGYPDDSLAHVSLDWMMTEAASHGLSFLPEPRLDVAHRALVNGPMNNNRSGLGAAYRYKPRELDVLCSQSKTGPIKDLIGKWKLWPWEDDSDGWFKGLISLLRLEPLKRGKWVDVKRPKIHHSVFDRIEASNGAYAPYNIPGDYDYVDDRGNLTPIRDNGKVGFPESAEQAQARFERQRLVENKIVVRKALYYVSMGFLILFAIYPFVEPPKLVADFFASLQLFVGPIGLAVQKLISLISLIPPLGVLETWTEKFRPQPVAFIVFLVVIGFILGWSRRVRCKIISQMDKIWQETHGGNFGEGSRTDMYGKMAKGLKNWRQRKSTDLLLDGSRYLLEFAGMAVLVFLLGAVASQSVNAWLVTSGVVCQTPRDPAWKPEKFGEPFLFDSRAVCQATGLKLDKGNSYRIELYVRDVARGKAENEGAWNWQDGLGGTIKSDLTGWLSAPFHMYAFTPYRRELFTGWYRPVAKVGSKLFEIYPLKPEKKIQGVQDSLITQITPQRGGRLFLYLNDAMVFGGGKFYRNNLGHACVIVTKIEKGKVGMVDNEIAGQSGVGKPGQRCPIPKSRGGGK